MVPRSQGRAGSLVALLALSVTSCGSKKEPDRVDPPPATAAQAPAPAVVPVPVGVPAPPPPVAAHRRLQLTLRSTPPGAAAMIDGRLVGATPVRWDMDDDGKQHDFTFTLNGYQPWRLKFSPSHDGVVHAHLLSSAPDAGMLP